MDTINKKRADVEIDDDNTEIEITFPSGCQKAKFTIDTNFNVQKIESNNIGKKTKINVNDIEIVGSTFVLSEGDEVVIEISKIHKNKEAILKLLN